MATALPPGDDDERANTPLGEPNDCGDDVAPVPRAEDLCYSNHSLGVAYRFNGEQMMYTEDGQEEWIAADPSTFIEDVSDHN